ncbi:MAG: hypothetical protein HPY59_07265 [Anaerolineae bacterium]|nr:hypothetical protein [Anaerolineae bacterium]
MKNKLWVYVSLAALALIGVVSLRISTRLGPGVGGDATIYLTSASNFVKGIGLGIVDASGEFRLLPYFPPFFPLTLAFFIWAGVEPLQAVLWLNIILFALSIWMVGFLVLRAWAGDGLAVLASALTAVSPVLIPVYSWAMAEPLAIFLGFAGIGLTLRYLKQPGSAGLLFAAGIVGGLSILTRYSMAAFLAAGAAGILLLSPVRWRTRLARAASYLFAGILPAVLWMAYDLTQTAAVSSRSMESAVGMMARLNSFWPPLREVFLFWLVPDSWISSPPYPGLFNNVLLAGMVLGLGIALGWGGLVLLKKGASALQDPLLQFGVILVFVILAYLIVVGVVYVTTYPPITIGTRMFSPLHTAVILFLVVVAGLLSKTRVRFFRMSAGLLVAGLVLLTLWWGWRSARIVAQNAQQGMGFNALSWKQSDTIHALQKLPEDSLLVTNEEMAVYYLTGRSAYPLAEIYTDQPLETFSRYGDGDLSGDEAQQVFRQKGAALVLFNSITTQLEPIYGAQTNERIQALTRDLKVVFRGEDGSIYQYPQP